MTEAQALLNCIGRPAMRKLIERFGGERIYVPTQLPVPDRDERIRAVFTTKLQHGSTCMSAYGAVADEFQLSVRRVQEIVRSA